MGDGGWGADLPDNPNTRVTLRTHLRIKKGILAPSSQKTSPFSTAPCDCGSKIGTQNGTLVSGTMDQTLWSVGLILTHMCIPRHAKRRMPSEQTVVLRHDPLDPPGAVAPLPRRRA